MKRLFSTIFLPLAVCALLAGCVAPGAGGKKKPVTDLHKGIIQDAIPRLEGTQSSLSRIWILMGVYPIEDYLVDKDCQRDGDTLTCLFKFRKDYKVLITWDETRRIQRILAGEVSDFSDEPPSGGAAGPGQ